MVDYISKIETEFNMPTKPFDKNYYFGKMLNYASFLRQKLELWMFVPCKLVEGVWVVLEEPEEKSFYTEMSPKNGRRRWKTNSDKYTLDLCEYQEAKERVLFEGFTAIYNQTKNGTVAIVRNTPNSLNIELGFKNTTCKFKTIEDLVKYDLILTPTAQKQIGL